MNRAIIIIHSSEIIRIGLEAVFENKFTARIICLSDISELKQIQFYSLDEVIFIIDPSCYDFDSLLPVRAKISKQSIIGITEKSLEKIPAFLDSYFSINESTETLLEKVNNFFSKNKQDDLSDELTVREKEILRLIALGHTNKTIADKLFISTHTVISHRKNITDKLGIKSIPGLTIYAIIQNIVNASDMTPDQLL